MERINVSFYDDIYLKIKDRAEQKNLSLSAYARQLAELGLRIEELSDKNTEEQKQASDPILSALALQGKLIKKELLASQESLFLTRYLVDHIEERAKGENKKMLEIAQLKSKTILSTLIEDIV